MRGRRSGRISLSSPPNAGIGTASADELPMRAPQQSRSGLRLFATHAVVCLVPVAMLGVALAYTYRSEAQDRGLNEAKARPTLLAKSGVEPQLDDLPVTSPMNAIEDTRL